MQVLSGSTFAVRDELKRLGCAWDGENWCAPMECFGQAQALVDRETWNTWMAFLGTLPWVDGEFTATVWEASLRAASLGIAYRDAWAEIASRVRLVKSVPDAWFDRNIQRAFERADGPAAKSGSFARPAGSEEKKVRPEFAPELLAKVAGDLANEVDLGWLASRSPIDPFLCDAHGFLSAIYEPDEHVVCFDVFESQGQWVWNAQEGFVSSVIAPSAVYEKSRAPFEQTGRSFDGRGADGIWYLCNPVDGQWRWMVDGAKDPHWSRRFHECVTSWRYLVLESDKAKAREWVGMAVQLPLRIAAIYTSGGKSVHVLVRVDCETKQDWDDLRDELKPIVVPMGADKGCLSAVRLTRLPVCWRGDRRQKLLYLNPGADMQPIASRPVIRAAVEQWRSLHRTLMATDATERDPEAVACCVRALEFYNRPAEAHALREAANFYER